MTELQMMPSAEVVTELDFHRLQIREHAGLFKRAARTTVDEALEIGRHCSEARAQFDIVAGRKRPDAYVAWLDETLTGLELASNTVEEFRVMYERNLKHDLHGRRGGQTITGLIAALRELEAPKEEKAEEKLPPVDDNQTTVEEVLEDPPQEDAKLEQERKAREEAEEKAEKDRKAKADAQEKAREANKKQKELEKEVERLKEDREELASIQRENMQKHIADVYARYDIPEVPEIFQATPEEFQKAVEGARTEREDGAIDALFEAMRVVGKMMNYEPEEAARAFLKWPSQDRSVRGVKQMTKWMQKCVDELDAQTTPGTLRAINREGE